MGVGESSLSKSSQSSLGLHWNFTDLLFVKSLFSILNLLLIFEVL